MFQKIKLKTHFNIERIGLGTIWIIAGFDIRLPPLSPESSCLFSSQIFTIPYGLQESMR
jgi:hypothetical protein